MANGIICDNSLITQSGVTFTHSTEVSGYPAENVQIYQPGESFRTTTLSNGYITASGIDGIVDTVAALYTNVTAQTNLSQQSNELDTTWSTTNLAVAKNTSNGGAPGASYSWDLTDDATSGNHSISQTNSKPATSNLFTDFESLYWTASAYVEDDGGPLDCRLRLDSATSHYVECSFDLGAGTAGVPTETGSLWGSPTAAITSVTAKIGTGTWYRVSVTGQIVASATTAPRATLFLESGGSISYSGSSDKIRAQALMVENSSSASGWVANTTDTVAFLKVSEETSARTIRKYAPCVTESLEGWPYVNIVASFAETGASIVRVDIYDPNNLDGYIEIGNLVVGKALQPTYNIANDWTIGWSEEGNSMRAPGGQMYRPINKRYRRLSMTYNWLTEAEAFEESFEIDRRVGRSEGVLAVVDPDSAYAHQWSVWGLQDSTNDTLHRRYVTSLGTRAYAKEWNIIEALP